MTRDRIVDGDGHGWPVTGYACHVCGWPADPVHAGIGTHPTCDPLSGGGPLRDGRARLHHPSRTTPMTDDPSSWMFIREPFDEVVDTDDPVEDTDGPDEDEDTDEDDEDDPSDTHRTTYRGDYR